MSLRKIFYSLPPGMRFLARRLYHLPTDTVSDAQKQPPKGLIYTGGGDFKEAGDRFLDIFKEHGGLTHKSRVLDIGCGIGRMALPMTDLLTEGMYVGFDAVKTGVDWCQKNISTQHPHFSFEWIGLKNDLYNSSGLDAATFNFPYDIHSFDLIIAISIFTHFQPDEVINYLLQCKKVLGTEGKVLATLFVIDEDGGTGTEKFNFTYDLGDFYLMDKKVKSANVAYRREFLEREIERSGLKIDRFFPGHWSGTEPGDCLDFQDIVVLTHLR